MIIICFVSVFVIVETAKLVIISETGKENKFLIQKIIDISSISLGKETDCHHSLLRGKLVFSFRLKLQFQLKETIVSSVRNQWFQVIETRVFKRMKLKGFKPQNQQFRTLKLLVSRQDTTHNSMG